MPTPRPETLVTWPAVENPGVANRAKRSRSLYSAPSAPQPQFLGPAANRRAVEAGAVVLHLDEDVGAGMDGVQTDRPPARLAGRPALFRALDAVIEGIAQQMNQGIVEALDHGLVEFGFGAGGLQLDVLAEFPGEVPDQALEFAERASDGQHADVEDLVAQIPGQPLHLLGDAEQVRIVAARR